METSPVALILAEALDRYPTVPRPITVLVKFACVRKLTPTICVVDTVVA